ncbi:MAG: DUF6515 family protein [Desulfuromonas sp.]|nr:DUF6515 family protein [Desulfuromonas sp.]
MSRLITRKMCMALVACLVSLCFVLPAVPALAKSRNDRHRPEYGQNIKQLPRGYRTLHSRHGDHYYKSGIFYRRYDNFYRVVRPQVGLVISTLPRGYIDVRFGNRMYARYNDVYYEPNPRGYVVVNPPPSAPPAPQPDVTAVPANALGTVAVTVEVLNVRSGPGVLHPVIDHVAAGDELVVLATAPQWYYVRLSDGGYGWVRTQFVRGAVSAIR